MTRNRPHHASDDLRKPDELLDRLERFLRLKDVPRAGWVLRGVTGPESVADHSWGTALLCLVLAPSELDTTRIMAIALIHDLAEVETGDIPRRVHAEAQPVSAREKEAREWAALQRITGTAVPGIRDLWQEYTRGESPEARFVRDMNLIDMCLQALIYERDRRYDPADNSENFPGFDALDEFFATSRDRFMTDTGRDLFESVLSRYRFVRDKRHGVSD